MGEECPNCRQLTNASYSRLVKDTCGHAKCRMCLLYEEHGCKACQNERHVPNIGNFDYPTPTTRTTENTGSSDKTISRLNEEVILPLELVINIPDHFECVQAEGKTGLTVIDSLTEEPGRTDRLILHNKGESSWCETIKHNENVIGNAVTTRMYIPKIEPLKLISNIRSHLEELTSQQEPSNTQIDSNITVKNADLDNSKVETECTEKGKMPKKKQKYLAPDRSHISIIPGPPEKYKCDVCGKIFANKKGKSYHDACITGIKPYKCMVCDRSFVKRSQFEYHERMHTGYKPFECTLCEKAFPQKNKLNRHMYSHKEEKRFKCFECGKGYSKRDDLINHSNIHAGVTPYICTICDKSFRVLTNLKRHMRTHSNERPHMCEQCGKSFKDKCLLVRHRRTHGKERPFSCADCIRVFLSKSELRRHLAVHSDEKPFTCKFCDTVFRRKDNLKRHIRHHHSEDSSREINKVQTELSDRDSKPARPKRTSSPKQKQRSKSKSRSTSVLLPKSPAKVSVVYVNSRDQINSRLDSMGNITPVIRATGELSNAVPVINGPISIKRPEEKTDMPKKTFTHTEPIPLAEAVVINRRIEEKLYPQTTTGHNYFFRDYYNKIDRISVPEKLVPETNYTLQHSTLTAQGYKAKLTLTNEVTVNLIAEKQQNADAREIIDSKVNVNPVHTVLKKRAIKELEANSLLNVDQIDSVIVSEKEEASRTITFKPERANCVSTITKAVHTIHRNDAGESDENTKVSDNLELDESDITMNKVSNTKKLNDMHWRRRALEILKPRID